MNHQHITTWLDSREPGPWTAEELEAVRAHLDDAAAVADQALRRAIRVVDLRARGRRGQKEQGEAGHHAVQHGPSRHRNSRFGQDAVGTRPASTASHPFAAGPSSQRKRRPQTRERYVNKGFVHIQPNIKVFTGGADYGYPRIQRILEF